MKSASQPSSEIRKAGYLTFAGIIFYCAHILQQAQARDAQVGVDVTSLDVTEVDSAESLSDQSSPMVAELKDSPLNDTETIATADLSVVQVADHDDDDDMTQGKDAVLADDSSGGISPIYLVGSTVLIGAGALLINSNDNDNDNDNGDDSSSTVSSSDPYDFARVGINPLSTSDNYSDKDFGVGVARALGSTDNPVVVYQPWANASGATYRSSDGALKMELWSDPDGVIERLEVPFNEISGDTGLLPLDFKGALELDVETDKLIMKLHYLNQSLETDWFEVGYSPEVESVLGHADDGDFIVNAYGRSFIWVATEDHQDHGDHEDHATLSILALDHAEKEMTIVAEDIDLNSVIHLGFSRVPKGFKMAAVSQEEDGSSKLKFLPFSIDESGQLTDRPGVDYSFTGEITDLYMQRGTADNYVVVESEGGSSSVWATSRSAGPVKLTDLSASGFEILFETDLNEDGDPDLLLLHRYVDGHIDMLGSVMSESGGKYDFAGVSLPATVKLQALHAESVIDAGEMVGVHFIGEGDLGSVETIMSLESIHSFGDLANNIGQNPANYDPNGDGIIELLDVIGVELAAGGADLPMGVLRELASGASLEGFLDAVELSGLPSDQAEDLADLLGVG
ncbi:MAG: hypothetical protein CMF55_05875 [Legionellales bacterium]|nr:hypothetical protein [Legionellales bacterium]